MRLRCSVSGIAACATFARLALALLVLLLRPFDAMPQTPTSAQLRGVVRSTEGIPLVDARVILEERTTGFTRSTRTDREGRFAFRLLPAGDYAVTAEKLGFRPQQLPGLRLLPGRSEGLALTIARAEPPIMSVDSGTVMSRVEWSRAGASRWFGRLELRSPRDREVQSELVDLATNAGTSIEGLPGAFSRHATEGFVFGDVQNAVVGSLYGGGALTRLDAAELVERIPDVQWDGGAAPSLLTWQRRGGREWSVRSWSAGSDPRSALGLFSAGESYAFDRLRAGAEVGGPIVGDTAVFMIGGEWRREAAIEPRAFRIDEMVGAQVTAGARDRDISLLGLTRPRVGEHDEVSGWGSFDWRIAANHDFGGFADFRMSTRDEVSVLRATPASAGASEIDITAGATLRSIIAERFANELRVGFARRSDEAALPGESEVTTFPASSVPSTSVVAGSILFGANPFLPSVVQHSALRLEQALLFAAGNHTLKVGLAVDWDSYEQEHAFARLGAFTFADGAGFGAGRGLFVQTVGGAPVSSVSVLETGAFLQDSWRPAAGVEVTLGLRYSDERLPNDGVQPNSLWRGITGIANEGEETRAGQLSPRFGLAWNVRDEGRWIVRAGFGLYHDDVAPQLLAERQMLDGAQRSIRFFGDVGAWPTLPDSADAGSSGRLLTMLGPDFRPPRSTRASAGISRIGALSVHLSGTYRQTDYLPARRDLNRLPRAVSTDQYGRAIFGELRQDGALVAAEPGSNRRFAAFDVVSALEASAFSEYWGITAIVERRLVQHVRLAASYTYSRSVDNWLAYAPGAPTGGLAPQLSDSASLDAWAEGTSSFDVPHRASFAAEIELPIPLSPVLAFTYSASSGLPFTPGFQPGVDVNGDYASNDPAFIDDALAGMPELLEQWQCLRDGVGGFAERNSCRGDAVHALDARFGVALETSRYGVARLYVDALNLLASEIAPVDAALYLVDADATLSAADGVTTIPLRVNPRFGQPVRSIEPGRVLRIGVEVSF